MTIAHLGRPTGAIDGRRLDAAAREAVRRSTGPTVVVTDPGSGTESVDGRIARRRWDALVRARAVYDPIVLDDAEAAVAAEYRSLVHTLVLRHGQVDYRSTIQAAEHALRKAIRVWPQPDHLWGFEEYLRGAIDTEIRLAQERRRL